jgi:hypothetical protein
VAGATPAIAHNGHGLNKALLPIGRLGPVSPRDNPGQIKQFSRFR